MLSVGQCSASRGKPRTPIERYEHAVKRQQDWRTSNGRSQLPAGIPWDNSPSERKKGGASATIFGLVSETRLAKRYFVSGTVQGVGYRFFTQRAAEKLRISGFVRNLWDGRVEVLAIATPEQHKELRGLLERGPMGSDVTEVLEEPAAVEAQYQGGFVIHPSA